jgi:hypothetical protein
MVSGGGHTDGASRTRTSRVRRSGLITSGGKTGLIGMMSSSNIPLGASTSPTSAKNPMESATHPDSSARPRYLTSGIAPVHGTELRIGVVVLEAHPVPALTRKSTALPISASRNAVPLMDSARKPENLREPHPVQACVPEVLFTDLHGGERFTAAVVGRA